MLERYLRERKAADYDFRRHAAPGDPLAHLFAEWVDYYRGKYAICRAIEPKSILEIGVRYGYSAITFLEACPGATYLGLDNDSNAFGGRHGALEWARRITAGHDARIEVADTQRLETLPGASWDLVHVDGQQDGDGTYHDMELALEKARWILVDGIFWSGQNHDASSQFVRKYRSLIEFALVLPGYAGDLLVRVRDDAHFRRTANRTANHRALKGAYTEEYFLLDCGGHEAFKAGDGRELRDMRLVALREMGRPWEGRRVLDVGCGRGELAYACYAAGAHVTGVDYADAAIRIATDAYAGEVGERLRFVCADVLDFTPPGAYDTIVAADFVEHLAAQDLDRVLERLGSWLAPGGQLLVHTWPNRIAYQRRQDERRRAARELGIFVPRNQRSLYEDEMHLNEQTPARLRRALARHFPDVLVWVGDGRDPAAGLAPGPLRERIARCDSVYAVASNARVDAAAVRARLTQEALSEPARAAIRIELAASPPSVRAGSRFDCEVCIFNGGAERIASLPPHPVNLSYHWVRDGRSVVFDGLRTPLGGPLDGGCGRTVRQRFVAPARPGRYDLVITLVQEGVAWLDPALAEGPVVVPELLVLAASD